MQSFRSSSFYPEPFVNEDPYVLMNHVLMEVPPKYKLFNYTCHIDLRRVHQANSRDLTRGAIVIYDLFRPYRRQLAGEMPTGKIACVLKYIPGSSECLIAYYGGDGLVGKMVPQSVPISDLFAFEEGFPDTWHNHYGTLVAYG